MNVGTERIRQIEARALRKLRRKYIMNTLVYKIDNDIENKKQELKRLESEIEKYNNLIESKGLISKDYNIYELNFSIRTTNCLVRRNIDSLEKLVKYTLNGEILKVRSLGKKCYFEILDKLQELKIIKYDNSSNKVDDVQKTIQLVRRPFVYIKVMR